MIGHHRINFVNIFQVVYGLKEITRTAYENLEYLRKSNEILLDIYLATTFIKDKTEYIQQRIFNDARNILLVLLFPRREGYLLDRVTQRLIVHPEGEQIGYVHRCYITDTCDILTRYFLILEKVSLFINGERVDQKWIHNSIFAFRN